MNIFSRTVRAAFTIIELLMVVAIILFLAKIIAPRYAHYYAKARQAEVAINLSALYTAQQAYHAQYGRYTNNLAELNWQPKGYTAHPKTRQNFYTYGSNTGREGIHFFSGSSGAPVTALSSAGCTNDTMLIKAAALSNGTLDIWHIDQNGELIKETPAAQGTTALPQ